MKIGLLEAGRPPDRLAGRFPGYGRMVSDLVGGGHDYTTFAVAEGRLPARGEEFGAFAITGSPASVYDPLPWIGELIAFLRGLDRRTKLVGLCFGHQVMAAAFGGRVEKSARGWGLGLHTYDVIERAAFMDEAARIAVPVSHQDQVVALPPQARVLAGSAFTPYGVLEYANRPAISFQCHPEFAPDYAHALTEGHRALAAEPDLGPNALASLDAPHDSRRVGGWIRRFLEEG